MLRSGFAVHAREVRAWASRNVTRFGQHDTRAAHFVLIVEAVVFPLVVAVFVVIMFRRQGRLTQKQPLNHRTPGIGVGSAAAIADAGVIGWPSLLDALSTIGLHRGTGIPSDPGGAESRAEPAGRALAVRRRRGTDLIGRALGPPVVDDGGENPVAEALGLHAPTVVGRYQPTLIYGVRQGRQVAIRLGIDETRRPGFTTRHLRQITVLRVQVPVFELVGQGGTLVAKRGAPDAVTDLTQALQRSPDVWSRLRVMGGPDGIVATRPVPMRVRVQFQWLYDLWLVERIANLLQAESLPPARLGKPFLVPYGLGRSG